MAYTHGIDSIRMYNIAEITVTDGVGSVTLGGSDCKDGVAFQDTPGTTLRTADGIDQSVSEKTNVNFEVVGLTASEVTDLKALHNKVGTIAMTIDNSTADVFTFSGVISVLSSYKTNDVSVVKISMEQSDYDVDTISVWST